MSRPEQEFIFKANRDKVLALFTGEQYHRTENLNYGNYVVQVATYGVPLDTGTWGVHFFVAFQDPEVVVSHNSSIIPVAMITLEQRRKNECRAILCFLPDRLQVRPDLKDMRNWAFGVGQDIVTHIWQRTIDAWLKQSAASGMATEQAAPGQDNKNAPIIKVLFLSAEPTDAPPLRQGEELREIQEKLQLAKLRDRFELHPRPAIRPKDISQALLDVQPQIVHFSGHGTSAGELCLENLTGQMHPVPPDALAALFEQFSNTVNCVLLNACHSEAQAKAIAEHISYVIGMNQAIDDKAAIAFAVGFYQALGAGCTIEKAYELGCVQIRLERMPERLTPVLICNR